jgi:peptidoglycan/LPS O-acetylase OafA/YrhL
MYIFSTYQFPEILRAQLLYLPLMAFIIYSFSSGNGVISKSLKNKTFVLMGEASFSLYMIHEPIINIAYLLYLKLALTVPLIIFSILLTVFCIASSLVTYKIIEQPIHKYLKKQIRDIN